KRRDFRPVDELAMVEYASNGLIDGIAEPPALRSDIDEGNGFRTHVLVHGALLGSELRSSAGDAARSLARGRGRGLGGLLEAADRNLETGDALVAGNRRHVAGADGIEKRDQLGAQRLVMADRQM